MKKILILLITFSVTSCDCWQRVSGTITDSETGTPINLVTVFNKYSDWNKMVTDSTGNFQLSAISGGIFGCPAMQVVIEKENYQKIETRIRAGRFKLIRMVRNSGK